MTHLTKSVVTIAAALPLILSVSMVHAAALETVLAPRANIKITNWKITHKCQAGDWTQYVYPPGVHPDVKVPIEVDGSNSALRVELEDSQNFKYHVVLCRFADTTIATLTWDADSDELVPGNGILLIMDIWPTVRTRRVRIAGRGPGGRPIDTLLGQPPHAIVYSRPSGNDRVYLARNLQQPVTLHVSHASDPNVTTELCTEGYFFEDTSGAVQAQQTAAGTPTTESELRRGHNWLCSLFRAAAPLFRTQ